MKKTILAIVVFSASIQALAATPSAYDQQQDNLISANHKDFTTSKALQDARNQSQDALIKVNTDKASQALKDSIAASTAITQMQQQQRTLTNTYATKLEVQSVHNEVGTKVDNATYDTGQKTQDTLISTNKQNLTTLQGQVAQKVDSSVFQQRAKQLNANIQQNHDEQVKTNQRVADNSKQLTNHERRIADLEANNQTNFNKLEKQQNRDRKEFRAGISGAIALASIPQAPQGHAVGFGMGVGTFNSETAVSAGVSARLASNVSVKTGLSWDSQGNVGAGAGFLVSY